MGISAARLVSAVSLALLASGAAAGAGSFDGLWRANPTADCGRAGAADAILRIEDDVLLGVDGTCRMTQPVDVRDMDAKLYDMVCDGDGGTFTERALFLNAADGGLVMLWNGYAFKYEACTAEPAIGTVTTADDIGVER